METITTTSQCAEAISELSLAENVDASDVKEDDYFDRKNGCVWHAGAKAAHLFSGSRVQDKPCNHRGYTGCVCANPKTECSPDDIVVEYNGHDANIQELVGRYKKRTDCERTEGGAWFGGADFSVCFDGPDTFMIWNTGSGWQIGRPTFDLYAGYEWDRRADTLALTTQTYTDDRGKVIPGLTSHEQKSC